MVCEHTCTSHSCTQWSCSALVTTAGCSPPSLSPHISQHHHGQAEPAQQCRVPVASTLWGCPCPAHPQHARAAASEHSGLGFTRRAQLGWARQRGPSQQCHPASALGGSHRLPTDLKGMNCKQYLGKSKSCWLSHVAEQLPAEV